MVTIETVYVAGGSTIGAFSSSSGKKLWSKRLTTTSLELSTSGILYAGTVDQQESGLIAFNDPGVVTSWFIANVVFITVNALLLPVVCIDRKKV